jgi:hypothetical protein
MTPFGDAFEMPSRGIYSLRIRDTVPASSASKIVGNFEWAGGYTWRYGFAYVGFQREKSGIDSCKKAATRHQTAIEDGMNGEVSVYHAAGE